MAKMNNNAKQFDVLSKNIRTLNKIKPLDLPHCKQLIFLKEILNYKVLSIMV